MLRIEISYVYMGIESKRSYFIYCYLSPPRGGVDWATMGVVMQKDTKTQELESKAKNDKEQKDAEEVQ